MGCRIPQPLHVERQGLTGTENRSHPGVVELQKLIKDFEVRNMEGAGHANHFEMPWECDRHCIEFLSRRELFPG